MSRNQPDLDKPDENLRLQPDMPPPIRMLGIGSAAGDDRAGLLVAQALEDTFDPGEISVSTHDHPGARLVSLMRGAQLVVLVDAVRSGAVPGTLHRLEGQAVWAAVARYTCTHGFGLAEALRLAEKLGQIPRRLVLWGIETGTAAGGEVSSAVREALPELIKAVANEVNLALSALHRGAAPA